jgi:hypothetical protein
MATHPDDIVRPNLEDVYTQLDAAIEAVTALSVTAIAVLPLDLQRACERSLRLLLDVKDRVNPGPDESSPF